MCTAEVFISVSFSCFLGGNFFSIKKKSKSCVCFALRACVVCAPSAPGFVDVRLRGMCVVGVPAESLAPTLVAFFFGFRKG